MSRRTCSMAAISFRPRPGRWWSGGSSACSMYDGVSMSKLLPRLRTNLDFMPSPVPDRPGLLIRDSYRYSDATLIIPPGLTECLRCFDGQTTELELRADLVRITGDL